MSRSRKDGRKGGGHKSYRDNDIKGAKDLRKYLPRRKRETNGWMNWKGVEPAPDHDEWVGKMSVERDLLRRIVAQYRFQQSVRLSAVEEAAAYLGKGSDG